MRVLLLFIICLVPLKSVAQNIHKSKIAIPKNKLVILRGDTSFVTKRDTVIYVSPDQKKNIRINDSIAETIALANGSKVLLESVLDWIAAKDIFAGSLSLIFKTVPAIVTFWLSSSI